MTAPRAFALVLGLAIVALLAPASSPAEMEPVGVVTRIDGTATLVRTAAPDEIPLKLRDPLFIADRITTGDQSLARLLLGGKALVTVRERSTLTITESAGTSTVDVGLGKIAIAVVKQRMKTGETLEIRTPNAVAAIRGTVVIAEVVPTGSHLAKTPDSFTTTITVLRGLIEFRQIDQRTRHMVGGPLNVGALQTIRVTGSAVPRSVQRITPEQAQGLAKQYKVSIKDAATASNGPVAANQVRAAVSAAGGDAAAAQGPARPDASATTMGSAPGSTSGSASSSPTPSSAAGSAVTDATPSVSGPTVSGSKAPAAGAPAAAPIVAAPTVTVPSGSSAPAVAVPNGSAAASTPALTAPSPKSGGNKGKK